MKSDGTRSIRRQGRKHRRNNEETPNDDNGYRDTVSIFFTFSGVLPLSLLFMRNVIINMKRYLHKFENENDFTSAYTGEAYHEPWVSYTTDEQVGNHVNYNRPPFFGEGFVFDGAQKISSDYGKYSLKMLHADDELVTIIEPNVFSQNTGAYYETISSINTPIGEGGGFSGSFTIKVINAKSLNPNFDDEVTLTMWDPHGHSCGLGWSNHDYGNAGPVSGPFQATLYIGYCTESDPGTDRDNVYSLHLEISLSESD